MTKTKLNTSLTFQISVSYTILPADEQGFPAQIDVTEVYIEVAGRRDKMRKVHLLDTLSEAELMQIEDEIMEDL
jgi:hypothetical protein